MLSIPKLSTKEKEYFKVLKDFRVSSMERLLFRETLCSMGLSQLLEDEFRIFNFSFLLYLLSFFFLLAL